MELKTGSPEEAGIQPDLLPQIRQRAEDWAARDKTQGLVLLAARDGVIFLHEAFGAHAPGEDAPPLERESLFPLASLTKPVTATALMTLVEKGQVGLNRPVREYIPQFSGELKDKVAVRHLLTHTSGLDDDQVVAWLESPPETINIPDPPQKQHPFIHTVLNLIYASSLEFPPGERMNYTDLGYYLAGEIVRRVSGMTLDRYAQEHIFAPLAMDDSFYIPPESHWSRVVRRPEDAPGGNFHLPEWLERPSPSGGMYSTARDMAVFCQMFLNRGAYGNSRILSPAGVSAMSTNQIPGISARALNAIFPEASWGLGWSVAHPLKGRMYGEALPSPYYFGHGGHGGVEVWLDPDRKLLGVYFSVSLEVDQTDFSDHEADLFMNMVSAGLVEEASHQPVNHTLPEAETEKADQKLQPGSPEKVGLSPQGLNRVQQRAQEWVDEGIHPSIIMLGARHGTVFLHEAFGRSGPAADAPGLTTDTVFPLASISKPITATAIMILVDKGFIGLNQPVNKYLPEFKGENKELVTVRNLLTHTSGLRDEDIKKHVTKHAREENPEIVENEGHYFTNRFDAPLSTLPNKHMHYADINYDLLGHIVTRISGMPFAAFAQQHIFQPLGMDNTTFLPSASMRSRIVQRPQDAPRADEIQNWIGITMGSRGVVSTALDLAVFGQMFLNKGSYAGKRILSRASVEAMTRNQIPGIRTEINEIYSPEAEWGFGWSIQETKRISHWGEPLLNAGTYCHGGSGGVMFWIDPDLDLVVVFLSTIVDKTPQEDHVHAIDLFINALAASIIA